ncbi:MAG: tetratricopeptide repeat protein [Candidatus Glassbacteria bacterium]|nr:tetratricopeptide repeat protein [Candidatus Glassbacteria bacterium]
MPPLRKADQALLDKVLSVYHPGWARSLAAASGNLSGDLDRKIKPYLSGVSRGLDLFVPAADPSYGVTERGGDAVVAYFTRPRRPGARPSYVMIDVSGFTKLLTFLTDRFGKQEAGDIMNMSILNRYCLNRMGMLIAHFGAQGAEQDTDPAADALKSALAFRSILGTITLEVRGELTRKLAGKPHQEAIRKFIKGLEIKASAGVVEGRSHGRSGFYGRDARARITWGRSARHLAGSEKVGGSDDRVAKRLTEVKGVGFDDESAAGFEELIGSDWLNKRDFRSRRFGDFTKVVLTPRGMDRLSERTWDDIARFENGRPAAAADGELSLDGIARRIERAAPYLQGGELLEQVVRGLGPEAELATLFDDRSSRVHDTGILFVNFTVSSGGLLDDLSAVVHRLMTRYGLVYKYNIFPLGDFNLMACLGLEVAGAPETERLYTEVLWQCWNDLLDDTRRNFAGRVRLRAGLSVGQCLQGPVGDNLLHNELTIIGPDCNLAARLVTRALVRKEPPGSLLAARNSYASVEHLLAPVKPFEHAELKGFSEPVPLYSLIPRGEQESPAELAGRLRRLPLVTDKGEVIDGSGGSMGDKLLTAAEAFVAEFGGRGKQVNRMLGFYGPAGLGKTRRLAEIMHTCAESGWKVLWAECMSWYQGSGSKAEDDSGKGSVMAVPFYPFIKFLNGQVFGIQGSDTPAQAMKKLRAVTRSLRGVSAGGEELVVVASFLGIESGAAGSAGSLNPEERRNVFFEQVAALFESLVAAHGRRLLLVIDDLQWADPGSIKLLGYLLHRVGGGLLFCTAARDRQCLEALVEDESGAAAGFMLLEAKPLAQKGVRLLARVALGVSRDKNLPAELDRRLSELENNPLFVTEFCRKLADNEVVTVRDGEVVRFDRAGFASMSVPNRVQSVIEELINSLPRRDFDLIRNGSVLGNVLRCRYVAEINSYRAENKMPPAKARLGLHGLAGRQVLEIELDSGEDSVYRFSRALIGQSLYQGITPSLRKRLHGVAAGIWQRLREDNLEKNLNCAMHYEQAEMPQKGAEYHLAAGRMSGELFENENALRLLDRVEKFCSEHKLDGADRMLLQMHEQRCNIALALGRYEKALEDSDGLKKISAQLAEKDKQVRAELLAGRTYLTRARDDDYKHSLSHYNQAEKLAEGLPLLVLEARNGQSRVLLETGGIEKCEKRAVSALEDISADMDDTRATILRARLIRTLATVRMRLGRNREGVETADQALEMIAGAGDGSEFMPVKAQLLNTKAICLSMAFCLPEALKTFYQARSLARKVGDVNLQLLILNNMSVTLNDSGENTKALDLLVSNYDTIHKLAGESRGLAGLEFNIGESYHFMGDPGRAEKHYRRALGITERISSRQFGVNIMYNLGEALRDLDKNEEARRVLERAARLARRHGYLQQLLDLENILGEMDMAGGNLKSAGQRHRRAIEIARKLKDDFGIGWSLRNLAEDLLQLGGADNRHEAGKLLEESLEYCRKAGQPENLLVTLASILDNWDVLGLAESLRPDILEELGQLARKINSKKYLKLYRKHGGVADE